MLQVVNDENFAVKTSLTPVPFRVVFASTRGVRCPCMRRDDDAAATTEKVMTVRIAAVASFAELLQQSGPSFSQSTRHGDSVDLDFNHGASVLPRVLPLSVSNHCCRCCPCRCPPALSQGIAPPMRRRSPPGWRCSIPRARVGLCAAAVSECAGGDRADGTVYRLTSLNTHVNAWFVLDIDTPMGGARPITLKTRTGAVAGVAGR
jgi:hypothetical protein